MLFRSENEMLQELVTYAEDKGLIDESTKQRVLDGENTENQYVLTLSTESYLSAPIERKAEQIYENIDVATANGEAIDRFGRLTGVPRNNATPCRIPLTLSLVSDAEEDLTIPAGTRVMIDPIVTKDTFEISENVTINAGTTTVNATAICTRYGVTNTIPANTATELVGFPTITVVNGDSVNGRNIEEDDDYRLRVPRGYEGHIIGTDTCIRNYLDSLSYVKEYNLIPRYDGVGTLKIVCDTLESKLSEISNLVYSNCMLVTDYPPLVVQPEELPVSSLGVSIHIVDTSNYSTDEIKQLVIQQIRTFVEGGTRRNGSDYPGLGIGKDLIPSQLVKYLLGEIPEVDNVTLSSYSVVSNAANKKISIGTITVSTL